jgi:hypothetical protein
MPLGFAQVADFENRACGDGPVNGIGIALVRLDEGRNGRDTSGVILTFRFDKSSPRAWRLDFQSPQKHGFFCGEIG